MANTNPNVDSLLDYVEQNAMGLIGKAVLGSETTSIINFQSGIKTSAYMNYLNTDVVFNDNSTCGFNPTSNQTISRRLLNTHPVSVQATYCDKNFLATFAQHNVRMAAGVKTLPFEEEFINGIIENIKAKIEHNIWQGEEVEEGGEGSLPPAGDILPTKDSLLSIFASEEGVINVTKKSTILATLQMMVESLPTIALKEDTKIFIGKDMFIKLVNEMVNANLYHFSGENSNYRMYLAGTTIEICGVGGLNGTNTAVLSRASNIVYGTDFEGDEEKFEFWYDNNSRLFKLNVEFNYGVNVLFPDEVVVCDFNA